MEPQKQHPQPEQQHQSQQQQQQQTRICCLVAVLSIDGAGLSGHDEQSLECCLPTISEVILLNVHQLAAVCNKQAGEGNADGCLQLVPCQHHASAPAHKETQMTQELLGET
jgi:hypothetical protein